MVTKKLIMIIFLILLTACSSINVKTEIPIISNPPIEKLFPSFTPSPTLTLTPTFKPTQTSSPIVSLTPTRTATLIPPTATNKPTATPIKMLILQRPVPSNVPVYHVYGYNRGLEGFHSGYDYGFLNCNEIKEPITAMGDGIVFLSVVDQPLRPGQRNGTLRIDYGIHALADGRISRVFVQFDHIVPIVPSGTTVQAITHVANFSTCKRYGYYPELHVEVLVFDPKATDNLAWYELNGWFVDYVNKNVWPYIDPKLVGLPPD